MGYVTCALARREAELMVRSLSVTCHVLKEIRGVEADFAKEERCKRKLGGATLCQSHFWGVSQYDHTIETTIL